MSPLSLLATVHFFTSYSSTSGTPAELCQSLRRRTAKGKYLSPRNHARSNRRRSRGQQEPWQDPLLPLVKSQFLRVGRELPPWARRASLPLNAFSLPRLLRSRFAHYVRNVFTSFSRGLLPSPIFRCGLHDPAFITADWFPGQEAPRWVHHHGSDRFGHVVPLVTPGGSCGVCGSDGGHFAEGSLLELGA